MSTKSQYTSLQEWAEADPKAYRAAKHGRFKKEKLLKKICEKFGWSHKRIYENKRTYENIKHLFSNYKTAHECRIAFPAESSYAYKKGWMKKLIRELELNVKTKSRTYKDIKQLFSTCKTYNECRIKFPTEFGYANYKGWLKKLMFELNIKSANQPRTYEEIKNTIYKCKTSSECRKKFPTEFGYAQKKKWLIQLFSELNIKVKKKSRTYEEIKKTLSNCKEFVECRNKFPAEYAYAYNKGWIKKILCELDIKIKRKSHTYESIKKEFSKCKYYSDIYKKFPSEYTYANSRGWIKNLTSELELKNKREPYTYEYVKKTLSKCINYNEIYKNFPAEYAYAIRNKWLKKLRYELNL